MSVISVSGKRDREGVKELLEFANLAPSTIQRCRALVEQGNAEGQSFLGRCYYDGKGVNTNYES